MHKTLAKVICILLCLGFVQKKKSTTKRKAMKHIEVALASMPTEIDPMKIWNYHHFMIVQSLYSTLVRLNENGRLVSHLAKNWTVSKDLKSIELKLNKDAKFTDGSPITSSDVAYSLARHAWEGSPSVIKGYLIDTVVGMKNLKKGKIPAGISMPNKSTIKISLIKPYAPFIHLLAMPGFSIVSEKEVSLGSGPMTGEYNQKTKTWNLKSRTDYFGKKSNLKSMNIRELKGLKKISDAFSKNEIDISMGFVVGDLEDLKLPKDVSIRKTDTLSYNHLFYNLNKKYFSNKEFRKEFGQLLQSIAWKGEFLSGYQEPLNTFLPNGVMHSKYYKKKSIDININDFMKKWKNHLPSEKIKIVVVDKHFKTQFINELEETLKNLGIKATVFKHSGADYMTTLKTRDYDIISGPYIGNFPDPDGFLEPLNPESAINFESKSTEGLFKNLQVARFKSDPSERLQSYSKIIREYEDNWSMIPLYRVNFPIVYNKNLEVPDSSYRYEAELWNIFWN